MASDHTHRTQILAQKKQWISQPARMVGQEVLGRGRCGGRCTWRENTRRVSAECECVDSTRWAGGTNLIHGHASSPVGHKLEGLVHSRCEAHGCRSPRWATSLSRQTDWLGSAVGLRVDVGRRLLDWLDSSSGPSCCSILVYKSIRSVQTKNSVL